MEVRPVALDRQSIEKKDFPIGKRGYDPDAVDAHLATLADEVADFKRVARQRSDTLATAASEQVRSIVEAAESSASDIQREAETEAREIRDEANSEAAATRDQATEEARDYLGKVSESTSAMLQRLDAMETELGALIDSLRTGANRLDADLRLLEAGLQEVGEAVQPRRFEPEEPEPAYEPEPEPEELYEPRPAAEAAEEVYEPPPVAEAPSHDLAPEDDWGHEAGSAVDTSFEDAVATHSPAAAESEPATYEPPTYEPLEPAADEPSSEPTYASTDYRDEPDAPAPAAAAAEGSDDAEGARLIALNMALNGTPRDVTARYLSENFQLADREGLLDEVYASVEG
jgi:DivIVA domain-containing protein